MGSNVENLLEIFFKMSLSQINGILKWCNSLCMAGVYLAPSQYEAGFTSLAHTEEDIDKTLEIVREVMSKL